MTMISNDNNDDDDDDNNNNNNNCERRVFVQCTVIPFIYIFCVSSGISGNVSRAFSLYLSFSFSLSGLF